MITRAIFFFIAGAVAVITQIEQDPWGPDIDDSNLFSETNFLGRVELGNLVHSDSTFVIYEIEKNARFFIKYQTSCESDDRVHPLVRDYLYTNKASEFGIAPKARYISKPNFLCKKKIGKCNFQMSDEDFEACKTRKSTLRYMIMDRLGGVSLRDLRRKLLAPAKDSGIGLEHGLMIGSKLVDLVETVHTKAYLIHGNICADNVMLYWDEVTGSSMLQLINFHSAEYISDDPRIAKPRNSARDDLADIFRLVIDLIRDGEKNFDTSKKYYTIHKRLEQILLTVESLSANTTISYTDLSKTLVELQSKILL